MHEGREAKVDKKARGAFYFSMSPEARGVVNFNMSSAVKARCQQVKRSPLLGSRTPIYLVQEIYLCCCCLHTLSSRVQRGELASSLLLCAGYTCLTNWRVGEDADTCRPTDRQVEVLVQYTPGRVSLSDRLRTYMLTICTSPHSVCHIDPHARSTDGRPWQTGR